MHVLCMGEYSGAENVAITLIKSMEQEVHSIYVSPEGQIQDILSERGIEHYAIEKLNGENIKKAIKKLKPDIIHAHDFTAGVVCASKAGKIPVINHLHHNAPWIKKICFKSLLYGISILKYKKILTVSPAIMEEYILHNFSKSKVETIGNPIDLLQIRNKSQNAISTKKSDLIFLGRLSKAKNPLLFIEIVKELSKRIPQIKVAMVGDGELRQEVEGKIVKYGLTNIITLYGFQKNPYGFLKDSRVLCMPSKWEGFGLAAVEALALGVPVVASPVGGLKNIVDEECGSLCENKEEFIESILEILLDKEKETGKVKKALEKVVQFDNVDKYKNRIYDIYKEII